MLLLLLLLLLLLVLLYVLGWCQMPEAEAVSTCQDGMRASLSSSTHTCCRTAAEAVQSLKHAGTHQKRQTRQQAVHVAACMTVRVFDWPCTQTCHHCRRCCSSSRLSGKLCCPSFLNQRRSSACHARCPCCSGCCTQPGAASAKPAISSGQCCLQFVHVDLHPCPVYFIHAVTFGQHRTPESL